MFIVSHYYLLKYVFPIHVCCLIYQSPYCVGAKYWEAFVIIDKCGILSGNFHKSQVS